MGQVITIGLDLAKSVYQVHGVDAAGEVVVRRQVRRSQLMQFFAKQPPCLIGMEACAPQRQAEHMAAPTSSAESSRTPLPESRPHRVESARWLG